METKVLDLRDTKRPQNEIERQITAAAEVIRGGGLVAIPTETVYGLGANALDSQAVERIFEAKGRPQDNPLILHVAGPAWLARYCVDVPPLAYVLARRFWPGPLTMILKRRDIVPDVTTAGLATVGVRCPEHPVTLAILREAGVPIAAPSANRSGRPSCTTAADVLEDMDGRIEAVVDGGPCEVGVESTIVDLTVMPPRLLRPGGLPVEELEAVVGPVERDPALIRPLGEGEQPRAPGMKYRHYAPRAQVTVVTGGPEASAREIRRRLKPGVGVICFDEYAGLFSGYPVEKLGPSGDKQAQARRVFDALRAFDAREQVTEIYAQCPDNKGLGLAINNRLKKAAAFRVVEAEERSVVLGITGGTGAGKTSALAAIEALGGRVLDCDRVYYEMLRTDEKVRSEIARTFGAACFLPDGQLDRKHLGNIVFHDPQRLDQLNHIIYDAMAPELRRRMEAEPCTLYAVDAINLIEGGLGEMCDRTVAVCSPAEQRVRRIMARDGIDEAYARSRLAAQKPESFYREKCDCVLENNETSPEAFTQKAWRFFKKLIEDIKEESQHGR